MGGRNIRLKGLIYEQDFKFGAGLREEIETASERYRATYQDRIREAREVYRTGVEIKRAANQKRHPRSEQTVERISFEKLALDSAERIACSGRLLGRDLVARKNDFREPIRDQPSERNDKGTQIEGGKYSVEKMRRTDLHSTSQGCRCLDEKNRQKTDVYTRGVLTDDGIRTTAIERIRKFAESTRETTQRFCNVLQRFSTNVRDYLEREQRTPPASQQLDRAGQQLERASSAVGKALQHEQSIGRERDLGDRGMSF